VRHLIILLIFRQKFSSTSESLKQTIKHWLPYAGVWLGFVVWRMFIFEIPDDPNAPRLLSSLIEAPIDTLLLFAQTTLQHISYLLVTTWYRAFSPELFNISNRITLLSWGLVAFIVFGLFWVFTQREWGSENQNPSKEWLPEVFILGGYAVFAGLLPVWFTGRDLLTGLYADRFTLPAIFGASILIVGVVYAVVTQPKNKIFVMSMLVALAVGVHVRVINEYRWDWVRQQRFYWQLAWRAPGLEPGTPVILSGAFSDYVAGYAASAALNTLYPQIDTKDSQQDYWMFGFSRQVGFRVPKVLEGMTLDDELRTLNFTGDSQDSLVIFNQLDNQCLWVLSADDRLNEALPENVRELAPGSNLSRILDKPLKGDAPPENIFGVEPPRTWCYYYEKADLARQNKDWKLVLTLEQIAEAEGHKPDYGYEFLPFIQAHAHFGYWDLAAELTLKAYNRSKNVQLLLCHNWENFEMQASEDDNFIEYYEKIYEKVGCAGDG
ncbi:MAG: hypothetical protein N2D54_01350, partial [Chloroflexota bacterium]